MRRSLSEAPAEVPDEARLPRSRWLRRGLLALVALELLYVLAFEWTARSGRLERWVNRRPDRWAVSFTSAHSWVPFYGTATGVEVRARTPALLVGCRVDRASGWLWPFALPDRRIRLLGAKAEGIEVRLRQRPAEPSSNEPDPVEAQLPEIAPLPDPPPGAPPPKRRWTIELAGLEARDVRDAWIGRFRFRGAARASGALDVRRGQEVEIRRLGVAIESGRVEVGAEAIVDRVRGEVDLALGPYDLSKRDPLAAFGLLTAKGRIEAELASEAARRSLFTALEGFELDPDPAHMTADFDVAAGEVRPGTRVVVSQDDFHARMFTVRCAGHLEGRFEVAEEDGGPRGRFDARVRAFEIRRGENVEPEIVGDELKIQSTFDDLRLVALPGDAVATIDLGEARLPNLATFSDTFPPTLNLQLEGGSGSVTGRFEVALLSRRMHGGLESTLEGVKVRYGDLDLAGHTRLQLALASDDLATGRFDLSGTRLDFSDFVSARLAAETPAGEDGWWAAVSLPEGHIGLAAPVSADGKLEVRLRDSVPLVGLFETRKNLPQWIERLLTVRDLGATAAFAYDDRDLQLLDFDTTFRKARIRAKARFGKEHRAGAMLVEWHKVALGLRFDDTRKRFKFVGVRPWYASQSLERADALDREDPLEVYSIEALQGVAFEGAGARTVALSGGDESEGPAGDIVPDRIVTGDLDGDGRPEAALLLRDADANALALAVAGEESGRPVSRALFALGEPEPPARMEIAGGELELAWPRPAAPEAIEPSTEGAAENAAAPPPAAERLRRFRLEGAELVEVAAPPPPAEAPPV